MTKIAFTIFRQQLYVGNLDEVDDKTVNLTPLSYNQIKNIQPIGPMRSTGLRNIPIDKVSDTEKEARDIYAATITARQQKIVDTLESFNTPEEAISFIMSLNVKETFDSTVDTDAIRQYLALKQDQLELSEHEIATLSN